MTTYTDWSDPASITPVSQRSFNKVVIYVDINNGSDDYNGSVDFPYETLGKALTEISRGGMIVLQDGTYTLNGYGSITKSITIQAAYGANPVLTEDLHFISCQGLVQGITFNSSAVLVEDSGYGSFSIKDCFFNGEDYPIRLNSVNYISIHQNRFFNYLEAIKIQNSLEAVISSNIFYSDAGTNGRAIYVTDIEWLDVYRNNIYGANSLGTSTVGDENLRVVYITLSNYQISRRRVSIPSFAAQNSYGYDVGVNILGGTSQEYGSDYTVTNNGITISWDGLNLQNSLAVGDTLRIVYSEGVSTVDSDAISVYNIGSSDSRIDSNNITDAGLGVFFTDNLRIRHNNFYNDTIDYTGTPTEDVGNTGVNPQYTDPIGGDFNLQPSTPLINQADPTRWEKILEELGVGLVEGRYTGISTPTRDGIAPFNRNLDEEYKHRLSWSGAENTQGRGEIGAIDYPITGTNPESESYIAENGYDYINTGSITGPYATVDRGFSGVKDLQVETNPLGSIVFGSGGEVLGLTGIDQGCTGYQLGRFVTKNIEMNNLRLDVGQKNKNSFAAFYPTYPSRGTTGIYVGPPAVSTAGISGISVGLTGSKSNPYLSIDQALSGSQPNNSIFVRPGVYPAFDGMADRKLVGLPELTNIYTGKSFYSEYDRTGWTGPADVVLDKYNLLFSNTGSAEALFDLVGEIYLKTSLTVVYDTAAVRLYVDTNNYVEVSKQSNNLYISYAVSGTSYSTAVPSTDTEYRVVFNVNGPDASVSVKGDTTNITRTMTLATTLSDVWHLNMSYTDSGTPGSTGVFSGFSVSAGLLSQAGVTGITTNRKAFGIIGERGLTGLYHIHGA